MSVLEGGDTVSVARLNGGTENVKVKLLTLRELQRYATQADDVAALAEMFAGKPKGWADLITPEAACRVVECGEALNKAPLESFVAYQLARKDRLEGLGKGTRS